MMTPFIILFKRKPNKAVKLTSSKLLLCILIGTLTPIKILADINSAALSYVEKLSSNKIELEKDVTLSENCSHQRIDYIKKRLQAISQNKFQDGDSFEYIDSKRNGDYAAVIIRSVNPSQPLTANFYGIALLHINNVWLPAPLPGSFTNSGYGYIPETEQSIHLLENWIKETTSSLNSEYRTSANNKLRAKLLATEKDIPLKNVTPEQVITQFIQHCQNRDTLKALYMLGASKTKGQSELLELTKIITKGLSEHNDSALWSIITNKNNILQTIEGDKNDSVISLGFFDPIEGGRINVIQFPYFTSDYSTYAVLPKVFHNALSIDPKKSEQANHYSLNRSFNNQVIPAILKGLSPDNNNSAEDALSNFNQALTNSNFKKLIKLLPREGEYFEKESNLNNTVTALSTLWKKLNQYNPELLQAAPLIKSEHLALCRLSLKNNKFDIWFHKDDQGWHILPSSVLSKISKSKLTKEKTALLKEVEKQNQDLIEQKQKNLLANIKQVEIFNNQQAIDKETAIKQVQEIRDLLRKKDLLSALKISAVMDKSETKQVMKNLTYAMRGVDNQIHDDLILGCNSFKNIQAVSIRTQAKLGEIYDYPLYLVINTEQGPMILLDVDLRYEINKGRELLNGRTWNKLKKTIDAPSVTSLKKLMEEHNKLVSNDIIEIKKMKK